MTAKDWIKFVREYGPVPSKDNLFDENLRRRSKRLGIAQVEFKHPFEDRVLDVLRRGAGGAAVRHPHRHRRGW